MGSASRDEQQQREKDKRHKIIFGTVTAVCAAFVAVILGIDAVKALKHDVSNFTEKVSEELSSQLPSKEQIDKAIDDVAANLPKELETDEYGYPELKEDEELSSLLALETKKEDAFAPVLSEGKEVPASDKGTVKEIIEADTFLLDISGKEFRARLSAIDVDETFKDETGKTALDIVRDKINIGDEVSLGYTDPAYDKFSRLLVEMTLSDGTNVKDMLESQGFTVKEEQNEQE